MLGGSLSSSSSATSAGTCDKAPADKSWPMMPPSQVQKDNPDLVAALKKAAKNNEVMLSLANGIMICKNTTICWWQGGNILESFLEIIDHNKITNHLIGVMDDETEAYLKGRPYHYFRVNIIIPESQKGDRELQRSFSSNSYLSVPSYPLLGGLLLLCNTAATPLSLLFPLSLLL